MTTASAIAFPFLVLCTLLGIAAIIWASGSASRPHPPSKDKT